jgi:hypothetical protein
MERTGSCHRPVTAAVPPRRYPRPRGRRSPWAGALRRPALRTIPASRIRTATTTARAPPALTPPHPRERGCRPPVPPCPTDAPRAAGARPDEGVRHEEPHRRVRTRRATAPAPSGALPARPWPAPPGAGSVQRLPHLSHLWLCARGRATRGPSETTVRRAVAGRGDPAAALTPRPPPCANTGASVRGTWRSCSRSRDGTHAIQPRCRMPIALAPWREMSSSLRPGRWPTAAAGSPPFRRPRPPYRPAPQAGTRRGGDGGRAARPGT